MYIKNIQIIFAFIALALMAMSSPISYKNNRDIDEYYSNPSKERKILFARSEEDEQNISSDEEGTIAVGDPENEVKEVESDSEVEEVSQNPEAVDNNNNNNNGYSNIDYSLFNWNLSSEDFNNAIEALSKNANAVIAQIEKIPDDQCSFESVILPLEYKFSNPYTELSLQIETLSQFHPNEEVKTQLNGEISKKLATTQMNVFLNKNLYHKILMVKENIEKGKFALKTEDDQSLLNYYESTFRKNGASLNEEQFEEFSTISSDLNQLMSEYINCLINDPNEISFSKKELDGLTDLDEFEKSIKDGEEIYTIGILNPKSNDIIKYAKNENTRKTYYIAKNQLCKPNIEKLQKIVNLRLKKAKLFGYKSHAYFQLEDKMAKTPEKVYDFLKSLVEKINPVKNEILQELLELKKKEKAELNEPFDNKINIYDIDYYDRMLTETKSGVNINEFDEYFPLNDELIQGIFSIYERVFTVKCVKVTNPTVYHPDVLEYNVYDSKTKKFIGAIYLDLLTRNGKPYGFAAPLTISYEKEDGTHSTSSALVSLSLKQPSSNKPTLLSHVDLLTLIHELGHSFHFLSIDIKYGSFNIYNIQHDFIEVPSTMAENWSLQPEILKKYSQHYQDPRKKLPDNLIKAVIENKKITNTMDKVKVSYMSMFDMVIHSIEEYDENIDLISIWNKEQKEILGIENLENTWPAASFGHIVNGYDVGYYDYLWSEVYSADIFYSQFKKYGILSPEVGERYRTLVLSKGASKDAMDLLIDFLGREPNDEAFINSILS